MNTKRMTVRAYLKAVNEEERTVEQIVSVFGNVDLGKDRVNYGAFKNSLERWAASGDPIPAIWSHTWDDPFAHIGAVLEARELAPADPLLPAEIADLGGLYVKYQVDDRPFADQVFFLLKTRRVREASFAYDVIRERRGQGGVNDLLELDLIEIGPTLKGMNQLTQLLSAKSLTALAAKTGLTEEALRSVLTAELDAEDLKAVSHTFVPGDDPARCILCGLTRNTVGHLNLMSSDDHGTKAVVTVTGSVEEVQRRLYEAAFEWALENNIGDGGFYTVHLEATFPDEMRAVFLVEGWNDPVGEGTYYQATFADVDGALAPTEEPVEVAIEGVVTPKARAKAHHRNISTTDGSSAAAKTAATVEDDGHDHKRKGKAEDPSGGKAEDHEASGSGSGTGEPERALLEIDVLDLT